MERPRTLYRGPGRTGTLAALLVAAGSMVPAPAQDFANTPIAILVTEAKLSEYGRGKVLGYFPAAALSRDPVRRTRGFFVFDTDEQRFERSQIAMQIQFQRGEQKFDAEKKGLETTKEASSSYSVATDAFLGKLATLLADMPEKVTLPANLVPSKGFDALETFTDTTPRRWYLRPAKDAEKKTFDADVAHSVTVDIGSRSSIEKLRDSFTKDPAAGALRTYQHHYVDQPITMQFFKLRSGGAAVRAGNTGGIHFVRHRDTTAAGGRIVVPRGDNEAASTYAAPAMEIKPDGAKLTIAADVLLKNIVAPSLRGDDAADPKLACVLPEEGDAPSACMQPKEGPVRVSGEMSPGKPLVFIVEKIVEGSAPDAFRAMYRVEMHFGANVPKKDDKK